MCIAETYSIKHVSDILLCAPELPTPELLEQMTDAAWRVWSADPGQQLRTTWLSLPFPVGQGERTERAQVSKLMGQDVV